MKIERMEKPLVMTVSLLLGATLLAAAAMTHNGGSWSMWGGTPDRNMVSDEVNMPTEWDLSSGKNVKWVAELGSQAYGNPVVSGGKILIGTNNEARRNPQIDGDQGVVMCFRESDGEFLWQATHSKLPSGRVNDWPLQGICSTASIDGDRAYYVSNRCEVVCVDLEGFYDGENDGPFQDEVNTGKQDADFVWKFDMMREAGVFPHNLAVCSPLVVDGRVFLVTGNGVDEGHRRIPSPRAPSFLCLNKETGALIWSDRSPRRRILHGQWSNPAYGVVNGQPQVYFPGGDGWLYAFDPAGDPDQPGQAKLIWKFDCNPKESIWELQGRGTRNNILATPVFYDNRVHIAVGQDPDHRYATGHLWCIDATKQGDVSPELVFDKSNPDTPVDESQLDSFAPFDPERHVARPNPNSALVWHYGGVDESKKFNNIIFGRTMSTVAVHGDLLFAVDLAGFLVCLDRNTGEQLWRHDMLSEVWGSPYVVDGKMYLGDDDGDVVVFAADKEKRLLAENVMDGSVKSTAVATGATMYIMTGNRLYALQAE